MEGEKRRPIQGCFLARKKEHSLVLNRCPGNGFAPALQADRNPFRVAGLTGIQDSDGQ